LHRLKTIDTWYVFTGVLNYERKETEQKESKQIERDAVAAMNTERKTETAQLNEKREAKRPSVAVALMRALEKEEMGKPKKGGITVRYGEDGKLSFISNIQNSIRPKPT